MPGERRGGTGRPRGSGSGERAAERGVGGLVGSGPSIVGVSGAMRARDVSPVSAEQLEEASRRVVVRRRPVDKPARASGPVPTPTPPHPPAVEADPLS
jgi:hypothetical protein